MSNSLVRWNRCGTAKKQNRSFAKACLDWSERKPQLAGSLGAALFNRMIANNWIKRTQDSRAIVITGKEGQALFEKFGVEC